MLDKRKRNIDNSGVDMKIPSYKDLISDLMESGMTQKEIGDHLGRSQAWVSAVFVGKFTDMKYKHAMALDRLHTERCACKRIKEAA